MYKYVDVAQSVRNLSNKAHSFIIECNPIDMTQNSINRRFMLNVNDKVFQ